MDNLIFDLLLVLPMHAANDLASLMIRFKVLGKLHAKDKPLAEHLFGKHRTWVGMGIIFFSATTIYSLLFGRIMLAPAIGIMAGVNFNSLIKRRLGIGAGNPLPIFDQLDFFIGGIAGLAASGIYLNDPIAMAAFTFFAHGLGGIIAYLLKIRDVWW